MASSGVQDIAAQLGEIQIDTTNTGEIAFGSVVQYS
jgi:hypothetical protein